MPECSDKKIVLLSYLGHAYVWGGAKPALSLPALTAVFNACVEAVEEFRSLHYEYAASYIFRQAQTDAKNPHAVGTGGTPFMEYLKKHRDETGQHRVR